MRSPPTDFVLELLHKGRRALIRDFVEQQEPTIYYPAYRYEESPKLMALARDRYRMQWLAGHWPLLYQKIEANPEQTLQPIEQLFGTLFLRLLNHWLAISEDQYHLPLAIKLMQEMEQVIKKMVDVAERSEQNRNMLLVALERNNRIFEREFNKLVDQDRV